MGCSKGKQMTVSYRLSNIVYSHGHNFSLQIGNLLLKNGGLYALTGQNGSGKSTLLRILALLITPQRGTIAIQGAETGRKPSQLRRLRQRVTLVEQTPYLFSGSVKSNLAFGLRLRGISKNEQDVRIEDALQQVGLTGFEQRCSQNLSGG